MDKILPEKYLSYGIDKNRSMIPNDTDGLISVQKRILLVTHMLAKKDWKKTPRILGDCLGKYHPHAESIGTVDWAVKNKFALGKGQWGKIIGINSSESKCAHPRYTEMKANPFIEELAFKLVRYVNWAPSNEEMEPEPTVIPTMIPFCLMMKKEHALMGFGFKPVIPCYTVPDLLKRIIYLTNPKEKKKTIKPYIPGCKVTSSIEDCEKALTTNEFKIDIQGKFKEDKINKRIYIFGWNPRIKFEALLNSINRYKKWNLLSNGDIGWGDETTDKIGTCVRFEVAKQRNTGDIYEKMIEAISESLKATISYDIVVNSKDDNVYQSTVDEILLRSYAYYNETVKHYYGHTIVEKTNKIKELNWVSNIRPHVSSLNKDFEKAIKSLLECFSDLDEKYLRELLSKYTIRNLITVSVDTSILIKELEGLKNDLNNADDICLNRYKQLSQTIGSK